MKRWVAFLLVCILLTGMLPVSALAADMQDAVPVQSIALHRSNVEMTVGESVTIQAALLPENTTDSLIWQSQDRSVATVTDGTICAVAPGETTVTAQAGELTAVCRVTVTADALLSEETYQIYSGSGKPSSGYYIHTIEVKNVAVVRHVWKDDDVYVQLSPETAENARVEFVFGKNVPNLPVSSASEDNSVTLSGGEGSITFTSSIYDYSWSFTVHLSRNGFAPELKADVPVQAYAYLGREYKLDLDDIFSDFFADSLTYSVKEGNGEYQRLDGSEYTFTPETAGEKVLSFKANNGYLDSEEYTLTLNMVEYSERKVSVRVPQTVTPVFYKTDKFVSRVDVTGAMLEFQEGETAEGFANYLVSVGQQDTTFSVRGTDAEETSWGGMALTIPENQEQVITLCMVQVSLANLGQEPLEGGITVDYGEHTAEGIDGRYLLAVGETYTVSSRVSDTAFEDISETYEPEANAQTQNYLLKLPLKDANAITVSRGATARLFRQENYYSYEEYDPKVIDDTGEDTVTYYFLANNGDSLSYRVTSPGKITKAGYCDHKDVLTVLHNATDAKSDARPTYGADANSVVAEDSVLINGNSRNHLIMQEGDTKTLKGYRTWEIIYADANNQVIMPDFHFDVVAGDNNVVELTDCQAPMNGNNWKTIKAKREGIAVIEVSYDAIEILGGNYSGLYGASDPVRTGLVVVQVGGSAANVDFGIECRSSLGTYQGTSQEKAYITYNAQSEQAWDAEFDTLYFTEESGTLRFSPTGAGISTVAVSNSKGVKWTTLTAKEGVYTATIRPGNNILRITTTSGATAYQVVRGDKISVSVSEVRENGKSDSDGLLEAGETVRIRFTGLHVPISKISGNYNPGYNSSEYGNLNLRLIYTWDQNTVYGAGSQYRFITEANYLDVQIPQAAKGNLLLSNGYVGFGVMGRQNLLAQENTHRNIPDEGCGMLTGYPTHHTRSILPDVTITVNSAAAANTAPTVAGGAVKTASITIGQNYQINPELLFADADGDTLTYTVSENSGAVKTVSSSYKYTPSTVGTHTLKFTASDGKLTASHTITLTVNQKTTSPDSSTSTGGSQTISFGLTAAEIAGYVTISFEDYGVRVKGETGLKIPQQLGSIVSSTKVPFKSGETVAQVTLRLLDALDIGYRYTGTPTTNFYLAEIRNFEVDNTPYASMGEFDAGSGSGWMITQNGIFINKSAGMFKVKSGDVIRWQYTCQLGDDIGGGQAVGSQSPGSPSGSNTSGGNSASDADNQKKADEVEKLISGLPATITTAHAEQIRKAVAAFEALTAEQKALVDEALVEKLNQAKQTIGALTTTNTEKEEAKEVEKRIEAIGEPVTLESEAAIRQARQAYDALTEGQKYLVGNYNKLFAAEEALKKLKNPVAMEEIYQVTGDYLQNIGTPGTGSVGGEWMVIGLLRSGRNLADVQAYYDSVMAFVQENINEKEQLHWAKSTENSRIILALTSLGMDVTNVDGHNLLLGLTDMEYLLRQGINGPIWALIAFDCGNYPIPDGNVTRGNLIETILEAQLSDGGWALAGEVSDPDMTGMALQALAPYYEKTDRVKAAVDKALAALSQMQAEDGSFASIDGSSSESIAQVIVALTALGIDPDQDERFTKNGNSAWDALLTYAVPGGGFCHIPGGERDGMSTEQGYYAMVSYYRMQEGKTSLYDMTDIVDCGGDLVPAETESEKRTEETSEEKAENDNGWIWGSVLGLCGCALAAVLWNRKKLLAFFAQG